MTRWSSASSRLLKEFKGTACEKGSAASAREPCFVWRMGQHLEGTAPSTSRLLADQTDLFSVPLTGCRSVAVCLQVSLLTFA